MLDILLHGLAILGGITLLGWVRASVAPEPEDHNPQRFSETLGDEDTDLALWLARLADVPVTEGNHVQHLRNGDEIFPPMLDAIRGAHDSVHFLTYVYWQGTIADEFADAFTQAAERGVTVRVILDAAGAMKMDNALVERMEAAGVEVAWFHPFSWYNPRKFNHRTHRKVLVVDGEVAFTGGVGIAEEWEGDARSESEWRDDHFELRGPCVQMAQGAFAENWLNATGVMLAGARYYPDPVASGSARAVGLGTTRREDLAPIALLYWSLFAFARESVDIATPYFVPTATLFEALLDCADRGVRVRLLIPGDHNDSRLVRWTALSFYDDLLAAGVEVHEFQPTMLHSKLTLVDGRWSVIGSANYDNRSLALNHEFILLVDDRGLHDTLTATFEHDLTRAHQLQESDIASPGWLKRRVAHAGLVLRGLI